MKRKRLKYPESWNISMESCVPLKILTAKDGGVSMTIMTAMDIATTQQEDIKP